MIAAMIVDLLSVSAVEHLPAGRTNYDKLNLVVWPDASTHLLDGWKRLSLIAALKAVKSTHLRGERVRFSQRRIAVSLVQVGRQHLQTFVECGLTEIHHDETGTAHLDASSRLLRDAAHFALFSREASQLMQFCEA